MNATNLRSNGYKELEVKGNAGSPPFLPGSLAEVENVVNEGTVSHMENSTDSALNTVQCI